MLFAVASDLVEDACIGGCADLPLGDEITRLRALG